MVKDWRLSTFNGALIASYFIPAWTIAALKIAIAPVRGLFDPANAAAGMYFSDHFSMTGLQTIRFAWLLALGKFTVAVFFLVFLVLIVRESIRRQANCDEALGLALFLGSIISMASLLSASALGEAEALRHHASEALVLIGAGIILIVDAPQAKKATQGDYAGAPLQGTSYQS
jgi:hypothetical protein